MGTIVIFITTTTNTTTTYFSKIVQGKDKVSDKTIDVWLWFLAKPA